MTSAGRHSAVRRTRVERFADAHLPGKYARLPERGAHSRLRPIG
ncbi:hypothetical protein BURMUCF1_A1229 [Burkholderia multivorans ATCC BAA-247]|nr:hypothetical protein BURMUCF1_A1229 [Burkholderia multivorans ATCC BAA-247]